MYSTGTTQNTENYDNDEKEKTLLRMRSQKIFLFFHVCKTWGGIRIRTLDRYQNGKPSPDRHQNNTNRHLNNSDWHQNNTDRHQNSAFTSNSRGFIGLLHSALN